MKIKFKRQKFQEDAVSALVNLFEGQPRSVSLFNTNVSDRLYDDRSFNRPIERSVLPDEIILSRVQKIQRENKIKPSKELFGRFNFTIEMETGVGKTYVYLKTICELYKRYGWSKFVIVVPSVAVREGVYKTIQITDSHFFEEYGEHIHSFIYNSNNIRDVFQFDLPNKIVVMIVNAQAFNTKGDKKKSGTRRLLMDDELEEFQSLRPIDIIARTNPILIIDEPQSVEGTQTKERIKEFNPLMTLRYSATHRSDAIYNMIYRLDAQDAYNKRLVKKIAVKGISERGQSATSSYLYLERINTFLDKSPTATILYDKKTNNSIRKRIGTFQLNDNIYERSGNLEEYQDRFIIDEINGRDGTILLRNGIKLATGEAIGDVSEEEFRRIQIRETILSHLERERVLFYQGIKVLSLFFIDEVAKYRTKDETTGLYAKIFEEEYETIVAEKIDELNQDEPYASYLKKIAASETHSGYFSVDKKGNYKNTKGESKDDDDSYALIMKDKERLLSFDCKYRFIFSHSALKEGWDNPNVFQICALKQSDSSISKRQEIGRGLRLCVNSAGERMDENALGADVHETNVLTVVASESYEDFTRALQKETAEILGERPRKVDASLFIGKEITVEGKTIIIDETLADDICDSLTINQYLKRQELTEKYYNDKTNDEIRFDESVARYAEGIIDILDTVYDKRTVAEDARKLDATVKLNEDRFNSEEFKALWKRISPKTSYRVQMCDDEIISASVDSINKNLTIRTASIQIESGEMNQIKSKESLIKNESFEKTSAKEVRINGANPNIKYDLIGKVVELTKLTRRAVVEILTKINPEKFNLFKKNPEEFIQKVSNLINEQKVSVIVQRIEYDKTNESFQSRIFTEPKLKGRLDKNMIATKKKNLYDHLLFDSEVEKNIAKEMETRDDVILYVKLPRGFYIATPLGKYNPDWAIAVDDDKKRNVYFVAETKGTTKETELRAIENNKIRCARKHFQALNDPSLQYEVASSFEDLLSAIKG